MRRSLLAATAALLTLPLNAPAFDPPPPMALPGDASIAAVRADPHTWLIGARPSAKTARVMHGQRHLVPGGYEVRRSAARRLAKRLGSQLTYAEPNSYRELQADRAVPDDPLTPKSRWRDAVIDPALVPPAVSSTTPLLALVDAKADLAHPEFGGGNARTLPGRKVTISHGTETLGVAAAPQNNVGIVGAYPGVRALNVPIPANRITCADSAHGIRRAINHGASVINMSYGSTAFCETEYEALQLATHRGVTLVAAGGNERTDGNPYEFPASLPHVITVGALTPENRAAFFSNTSAALDLVAPGVGIIAPLPPSLDTKDGTQDGYETVDGTSFAAPIVAAAADWLRTVRPELTVDQVAQAIRLSAIDIYKKGYDIATGYGKLNLARALVITPPKPDVLEPNEDFRFVDGRAFGRPATAIWHGGPPTHLSALLDLFEDPTDIYRIRIPAHRTARIEVEPRFGNPDLIVYAGGSRTIGSSKGVLAHSRHTGRRTDRVAVRNHAGRTRTALVRVYVRPEHTLDSRYRLTIRR